MTKRTKFQRAYVTGGLFALVGLTSAGSASAQEWLHDRNFSEGPGVRTGDFELHPGIGGEAGYDSNWFLRTDKTGANIINGSPTAPRKDAGEFRITPSLTLKTVGGQRVEGATGPAPTAPDVAFRAGISGTYRAFLGDSEVRNQSNSFAANADFRLDILPSRPWSFALFGSGARAIQPNTLGNPDLSYNHDDFGVGGEVIATPHSGTLDMRAGYQLHGTYFEDTSGVPFDNLQHELSLRSRWTFRPQTAFLYDATFRVASYSESDRANTQLHDSTPLRARIGLSGLVTPRLSATVMAGWGASFFRPGTTAPQVQQYDSVIGTAQVSYFLTKNPRDEPGAASLSLSTITVGYNRDFSNSYLSDYYGTDRGFVRLTYFFASRFLLNIEGGAGAIEYPRIYYTPLGGGNGVDPIHPSFTDARVDATIFGEYRFTSSFGLNATLGYQQNFSSAQLPVGDPQNGVQQVYDMSWKRFQALIGLRFFL